MMSALISFLGGSAFRMIWGEVSAYFDKRQEHRYEIERLEHQEKVDAAQHARNLESMRLQNELGVKVIEVQRDADLDRIDAQGWENAVEAVGKATGIKFIDIWNQSIRPFLATASIVIVLIQFGEHGFVLTDWDRELVGAILGIYVADRSLAKRGK